MNNPKLRSDIQPFPVSTGKQRMISFLDPLRLAETGIALDLSVVPLLRMLDGAHSIGDIQLELMHANGGNPVPVQDIEDFIRTLDESMLLESELFFARRQAVIDEFSRAKERRATLAGTSYEKDPERLRQCIGQAEQKLPPPDEKILSGEILGILAPHIDISIALDTYVDAYRYLRGRSYDLAIVLGINHNGSGGLWSVSDKDYLTPLGALPTDRDFVAGLRSRLPEGALAASDFDHKTEHSVEFQTVFLRHYLGDGLKIAPILCGSIHEFIHTGNDPMHDPRFLSMKQAIQDLTAERGLKTLIVSGVDFSHVGPKFGHDMPAEGILPKAQAYDEAVISALQEGSPENIFARAAETKDYCNICGLPSLLLSSWILRPCSPKFLGRKIYNEGATRSAVTYAAMLFMKQ